MEEVTKEKTSTDSDQSKQADSDKAKASSEAKGRQGKTWFPYITKVQFDKFIARLESNMPEQIDRDYVRAIIRTPSMIYRFLRGIEAMKLIDKEQQPTQLLVRVVEPQTRSEALKEVQSELYKELLEKQETSGDMNDEEIIEYFRDRTGMGRDSANKMKMFFKYLSNQSNFSNQQKKSEMTVKKAPVKKADEEVSTKESDTRPKENVTSQRSSTRTKQSDRNSRDTRDQHRNNADSSATYRDRPPRPLNEQQKAYLDTVRTVVNINIDGDWDEDMMRVAFDRLERLLERIRRI